MKPTAEQKCHPHSNFLIRRLQHMKHDVKDFEEMFKTKTSAYAPEYCEKLYEGIEELMYAVYPNSKQND